ncbi:hypothetical protein BPUTSESOX_1516 [uncultured Gammaproteobacteria bacterium]|jgi:hypothetical protein|nr:hypothetical protein [uncultured Gammaproteobacteria bacterium]VVH51545.1 hypothetical protein BPUTSESOX_1516 [uncultured Gammaproteobacteria bacterium]
MSDGTGQWIELVSCSKDEVAEFNAASLSLVYEVLTSLFLVGMAYSGGGF